MNFETFNFHPCVAAGVAAAGYQTPTPIQARAIPKVVKGRDVMGLAQTGTGKTAAFVLPILNRLVQGKRGCVRALIIAPTRELAEQDGQLALAKLSLLLPGKTNIWCKPSIESLVLKSNSASYQILTTHHRGLIVKIAPSGKENQNRRRVYQGQREN